MRRRVSRLLFRGKLYETLVEFAGYAAVTVGISRVSETAAIIFAGVVAIVIYGNGRD